MLRTRWQLLKRCLFRSKKRTLLQSLLYWKSWTSERRALSKGYDRVVRSTEWRLLRKATIDWKTVCCKTIFRKSQKKKATLVFHRRQLQKFWKRWSSSYQEHIFHRDVATQLYARKKLVCYFVRWKNYFARQALRHTQAWSCVQQRTKFLMRLFFTAWLDTTRHHLMVLERLVAFLQRGHHRLKKNIFQFWLQLTLRNEQKRSFMLSLKLKKARRVKARVLAYLARQTLQRHLIDNFVLRQFSRRRLYAFNGWRLQVTYQNWVWAKRKHKEIYTRKHTFIAWLLFLEMSRTHAALERVQHLQGMLNRTLLEMEEFKKLRSESEKLYSSPEIEINCARKNLRCTINVLPLLEARLQWAVVPEGSGPELSPRAAHSSVRISFGSEVSSFIVVFGGYNGSKAFGDVICFDTASKEWKTPRVSVETGSAFPRPAWNHTACSYKNKMIIFGGFDGRLQSSEVSVLSFLNDDSCSWSQPKYSMGASPSPLSQHTSCLYDEGRYMVVFGGYSACKGHLNELWILDLHSMSWTSPECFGTPPPSRRGHGAAVVGTKMYVFGGFDGTSHLCDVQVLDLQSFTWTCMCTQGSGPTPRRHHTLEAVGGHLVVYGGFDGVSFLEDVYSFDISTSAWKAWNPLKLHINSATNIGGVGTKFARSLHTMTLDKNRLFVFGGVHENDSLQDSLFLENMAGVQGAHMESLLLAEVAKGLKLQVTLRSSEELLEKRSREMVKLVSRASQLEQAVKDEQMRKGDLINKNRVLKRKLVKARTTLDNYAISYAEVRPARQ